MCKYVINTKTHTLHLTNGCRYAKGCENLSNYKFYATEEQVIAEFQNHFKHCKLCFGGR